MHWCWGHAVRPQRKGPNSEEWALRLTSHKLSWHTHDSSLSQAPSWKLKRSRFFESKSWPKLTKADSAGSLRIPQRVYHHRWDKSGHPQLSLASASSHSQEPQHGNLMTTSWEAKLCGCAPNRFRSSTVQWMHFNICRVCRVCRVCRGLWRLRHLQDALQSAFILRPCCTFWRTSGDPLGRLGFGEPLEILCKASGLLVFWSALQAADSLPPLYHGILLHNLCSSLSAVMFWICFWIVWFSKSC